MRTEAEAKQSEAKAKLFRAEQRAAELEKRIEQARAEAVERFKGSDGYDTALQKVTFLCYESGYRRGLRKRFAQGFHRAVVEAQEHVLDQLVFAPDQR